MKTFSLSSKLTKNSLILTRISFHFPCIFNSLSGFLAISGCLLTTRGIKTPLPFAVLRGIASLLSVGLSISAKKAILNIQVFLKQSYLRNRIRCLTCDRFIVTLLCPLASIPAVETKNTTRYNLLRNIFRLVPIGDILSDASAVKLLPHQFSVMPPTAFPLTIAHLRGRSERGRCFNSVEEISRLRVLCPARLKQTSTKVRFPVDFSIRMKNSFDTATKGFLSPLGRLKRVLSTDSVIGISPYKTSIAPPQILSRAA